MIGILQTWLPVCSKIALGSFLMVPRVPHHCSTGLRHTGSTQNHH